MTNVAVPLALSVSLTYKCFIGALLQYFGIGISKDLIT